MAPISWHLIKNRMKIKWFHSPSWPGKPTLPIPLGKWPSPSGSLLFTLKLLLNLFAFGAPQNVCARCRRLAQQGCSCWDHGWLPGWTTRTVNYINPISSSTLLVQARLTCRLTRLAKGPQALVGKLLNRETKCLPVTSSQYPLVLEISQGTGKRPSPYTIVYWAACR